MAEVMSTYTKSIVLKGYNPGIVMEFRANGSDIKPGHIVTNYGESNVINIDLCGAGEPPLGVALEHRTDDGLAGTIRDTPDIDTAYTDEATIRIAICGAGMVCHVFLAGQTTTTTVYAGSNIVAAASGETQLPTFTSTTAQLSADWLGYVGKSVVYNTGGSTAVIIAVAI